MPEDRNHLIDEIKPEDVINLENKLCPRTYISATDSRLNYTFCKEEDIKEKNNLPEVIGRELIDYGVKKIKKNPKKPIPQGLTIMKGKFSVSFD